MIGEQYQNYHPAQIIHIIFSHRNPKFLVLLLSKLLKAFLEEFIQFYPGNLLNIVMGSG
ncbi:MAG: hypothetical protein LLF83_08030 [Methanobacterium sp.]|nr:hypothetical protein [Methanobacterium sp.]